MKKENYDYLITGKDDKGKATYVELPKNKLKPVNGRIFIVSKQVADHKTASGLILPSSWEGSKQSRKVELNRYFVVDVAPDVELLVAGRPLKRGDEVSVFIPAESDGYNVPVVSDYYHEDSPKYGSLHFTELSGIFNREPEFIKDKKD